MASDENKELEELRKRVKGLKEEREKLNAKIRSKRDSMVGLYSEIDKLLKEARKHKDVRDAANKRVSTCKKERDAANKKIAELNKKLAEFKRDAGGTISQRDYKKLKRDYESLNWKMQTSPTSKDKEALMVKRLEEMEIRIKEYELLRPMEKDVLKLEKELRSIRKKADSHHKKLLEQSEAGEVAHAEMHGIYKLVDSKREKVKKSEEEFLKIKKELNEAHERFVEVLNELRAEEDRLGIKRARRRSADLEKLKKEQKSKEKDLLSELKKGGVITTDDLLMLQDVDVEPKE